MSTDLPSVWGMEHQAVRERKRDIFHPKVLSRKRLWKWLQLDTVELETVVTAGLQADGCHMRKQNSKRSFW